MADADEKPPLQRQIEQLAQLLNLNHGQHRLELVFVDGALVNWWAHSERRSPRELSWLGPLDVAD